MEKRNYPYASLTAGLLARKGEALPAMESFDPRAPISQDTVAGLDAEPVDRAPVDRNLIERAPVERVQDAAPEAADRPSLGLGKEKLRPSEAAAAARRARVTRRAASIAAGKTSGPEPLRAVAADVDCEDPCTDKYPAPPLNKTAAKRRAAVTIRLTTHDFMRLKLASAELAMTSQDILTKALATYLDAHEVETLSDCTCLRRAAERAEAAAARGGDA